MKTFLRIQRFSFLFLIFINTRALQAQFVPELVFENPVVIAGTAGQDGCKYLFSNVAANLDAVVTVINRSDPSVILQNIDSTGGAIGFNKALQPIMGWPGIAPANTTWWMKFNCTFFDAGTNQKAKLNQFMVTGLDIDGDAVTTFEWAEMDRISKIDSALINSLTFTKLGSHGAQGDDYKITGIIANSPGIDTSAFNVMATYTYDDKDNFDFTLGATTSAATTSAGVRFNALWFKQFSWAQLPLKMVSFSAVLNNSKTELTWKTVSESNVSHFEVEKSLDGRNFTETGIVLARGNETDLTTYQFFDPINTDQEGVVYYRIRSVDVDGKYQYSDVRIIRITKRDDNNINIMAYPNPVTNELRVTIPSSWQNKKITYELFNANGQTDKKTENVSSNQTETLNVNSLAPGFYIIRVSCNGETAQQKIIKQ